MKKRILMKKIILFFFVYCLLLTSSKTFAQSKEVVWSDQAPWINTKADPNSGVLIDSVITLLPIYEMYGQDIALDITLDGTDWKWPDNISIGSAEDIDVRTLNGQDLYLITDRNGRILEYNVAENNVVFTYEGPDLVLPVDAFGFQGTDQYIFLVTDRGNNRVMEIGRETGNVLWYYGDPNGLEGSGNNQLTSPADAVKIPGQDKYIIADRGNDRVIIVTRDPNRVIWQIGPDSLNSPVDVEYVGATNEILVTDRGNNRVFLVNVDTKQITWQFGKQDGSAGSGREGLNAPEDADYLPNGHIIIADAGNNRVVEVGRDTNYYWELKRPLANLRDVDQINTLTPALSKLFVVYRPTDSDKIIPVRISFKDGEVISPVYGVPRGYVNFDQIFWDAVTSTDTTSVQLQFRSAIDDGTLARTAWSGPQSVGDTTYTVSGQMLGSAHKGHRVYQFKAFLKTSNPKETPILNNVSVKYHYYSSDVQPKPFFFTGPIGITDNRDAIPKWKRLVYRQELPQNSAFRENVQLLIRIVKNEAPYLTLHEEFANTKAPVDTIDLEQISAMRGVKAIFLNAYPRTNNPAVSPALVSWKVVYEEIETTASSIRFVNKTGEKANAYLATTTYPLPKGETVDSVNVILDDNNTELIQSSVDVDVVASKSGDTEKLELTLQPPVFRTIEPLPMVITDRVVANNDTMEVFDRDTLKVKYQDINDPKDTSEAAVLVVQATPGELFITNKAGKELTEVIFGDSIYFRVSEEQDKNLNPFGIDSLKLKVINNATVDEETVYLYELQNNEGVYDSDVFVTRKGLFIEENNNGIKGDGILQSAAGQRITAEYVDNFTRTKSVLLPEPSVIIVDLGGVPYVVEVAPNPYYSSLDSNYRLRLASATGSITVRFMEIFNLAGEKVREIDGSALRFSTGSVVPKDRYGIVSNWWDLTNDSGQQIASGTYFLKVHADIVPENTNNLEQVVIFRKFVVVR
jgi:hypothetical protein